MASSPSRIVTPKVQPPDSLHIQAAQGWLELGNHVEANEELEKVTPRMRNHPEVLAVSYDVYAAAKNWTAALDLASAIVKLAPNSPVGWLARAQARFHLGQVEDAARSLLGVVDQFPRCEEMRYELAVYECRLGRLDEARRWLCAALEVAEGQQLKLMALDDPNLEPLWRDIGKLP